MGGKPSVMVRASRTSIVEYYSRAVKLKLGDRAKCTVEQREAGEGKRESQRGGERMPGEARRNLLHGLDGLIVRIHGLQISGSRGARLALARIPRGRASCVVRALSGPAWSGLLLSQSGFASPLVLDRSLRRLRLLRLLLLLLARSVGGELRRGRAFGRIRRGVLGVVVRG